MLLANERNLGFTLTANRGMRSARAGADVVLLNSDTIVTSGWLEALARCVHSDPAIGTATPFSNNAEICSLPRFCENNAWPVGRDPEPLAQALRLAAVPTYPDLPTGVGFCMYMRRETLETIGAFDPVFGLGYGEENDFCMRAAAAGYRNVLCDDAFVLHMGGSSFGDKRRELAQRNGAILLERHPTYDALVREFIAADPLRPLREFALSQHRVLASDASGILHVIHGHGGGTEYHARSLIAASSSAFRHYLLMIVGDECVLEAHDDDAVRCFEFARLADESWSDFLGGICERFRIDLVHLHNISGGRDGLAEALATHGIAYGYTVHDLSFACPTITFLNAGQTFCGAVTDPAVCNACLAAQPAFADTDIVQWRESHGALLAGAAFVIAPSQWAAATLHRYFPQCAVDVIPHAAPGGTTRPDAVATPLTMADDERPVVAVLGAIGPDKGSRRLERLVELTRAGGGTVALGAHRLSRLRTHAVAIGRWRVHPARAVQFARAAGAARSLPRAARRVPVGVPGDVQLHAVRGLDRGTAGDRAADRGAGGPGRRHRRRLDPERARLAVRGAHARTHRRDSRPGPARGVRRGGGTRTRGGAADARDDGRTHDAGLSPGVAVRGGCVPCSSGRAPSHRRSALPGGAALPAVASRGGCQHAAGSTDRGRRRA